MNFNREMEISWVGKGIQRVTASIHVTMGLSLPYPPTWPNLVTGQPWTQVQGEQSGPPFTTLQVEHSRARMLAQFASDGSLPDEMRRPTQLHYMMFSLQGWYTLARIAEKAGVWLLSCKCKY